MNLEAIADLEASTAKLEERKAKKESLKCGLKSGVSENATSDIARKNNAMLYKTLKKDGMSAKDALAKASEVTGIKLSQNVVLRDYKRLCLGVEE
jgi:hypothetical protein